MLKIAIVGRPNVGKSTLFNALIRKRQALVADEAGLTRDRHYGIVESEHRRCLLVDTGGMTFSSSDIDQQVFEQTRFAIDEADLILFCVCVKEGLTAADKLIMDELRRSDKTVWLVANKNDSGDADAAYAEFAELGIGTGFCVAALRGRGIKALSAALFDYVAERTPADAVPPDAVSSDAASSDTVPPDVAPPDAVPADAVSSGAVPPDVAPSDVAPSESESDGTPEHPVRVAFWGRPNAGKSTLINSLLKESRLLTSDVSGTTRDSIEVPFSRGQDDFVLVDTAGVRKKRVSESAEKLSLLKALEQALISDVIVLVCDAGEGVTEQDASLAAQALEAGCALVITVNKSDLINDENRYQVQRSLDTRLGFLPQIEVLFVAAKLGRGIGQMMKAVLKARQSSQMRISTPACTRLLRQAVERHPPPLDQGRRVKLRYAHQGGVCPPRIIVHGNRVERLTRDYRRYLERFFCKELGLVGTPLMFEFRRTENPYREAE